MSVVLDNPRETDVPVTRSTWMQHDAVTCTEEQLNIIILLEVAPAVEQIIQHSQSDGLVAVEFSSYYVFLPPLLSQPPRPGLIHRVIQVPARFFLLCL